MCRQRWKCETERRRKEDSKKAQNNEGYWRNYLIIVGVISGNLMLVLGFESRWLVRF